MSCLPPSSQEHLETEVFGRAELLAPCILVLDDLDVLAQAEHSDHLRACSAMVVSNLEKWARNGRVQTVGVARNLAALPRALRAAFTHTTKLALPTFRERERVLTAVLPDAGDTSLLAQSTHGFSFAELTLLAQLANTDDHPDKGTMRRLAHLQTAVSPASLFQNTVSLPRVPLASFAGSEHDEEKK
jgi:hypothetical protein